MEVNKLIEWLKFKKKRIECDMPREEGYLNDDIDKIDEIIKHLQRNMKTDKDIKNIKKFFKEEVAANFHPNTTHSFCLGYIVALFDNDLITKKQKMKLIKYCDKRL